MRMKSSPETGNKVSFILPPLGAAPGGKAKILRWLVQPGERVTKNSEIIEVEADKCAFGVECPCDGVLESQGVEPGNEVAEGSVLGLIRAGAVARPQARPFPSNTGLNAFPKGGA